MATVGDSPSAAPTTIRAGDRKKGEQNVAPCDAGLPAPHLEEKNYNKPSSLKKDVPRNGP